MFVLYDLVTRTKASSELAVPAFNFSFLILLISVF